MNQRKKTHTLIWKNHDTLYLQLKNLHNENRIHGCFHSAIWVCTDNKLINDYLEIVININIKEILAHFYVEGWMWNRSICFFIA